MFNLLLQVMNLTLVFILIDKLILLEYSNLFFCLIQSISYLLLIVFYKFILQSDFFLLDNSY